MITLREFIDNYESDIDVCDNYNESLWLAYCGTRLTDAGEEVYGDLLDTVMVDDSSKSCAILEVDNGQRDDQQIKTVLRSLKDMFWGMAGYISEDEYNRLFIDNGDN